MSFTEAPTVAAQQNQKQKQVEHIKTVSERFPTAEYNQLDSADPQPPKKKRYNDEHLVKATVNPETVPPDDTASNLDPGNRNAFKLPVIRAWQHQAERAIQQPDRSGVVA